MGKEQRTSQGNIIALACGPLKRKRYINPKIELELIDFKKEIEEKFGKSPLKKFQMPRKPEPEKVGSADLTAGANIFGPSRIQKGRQLAQSTDATAMQSYLHPSGGQNISAGGQLPQFSSGQQGYPMLNQNTSRKMNSKGKPTGMNIMTTSTDYSLNGGPSSQNTS